MHRYVWHRSAWILSPLSVVDWRKYVFWHKFRWHIRQCLRNTESLELHWVKKMGEWVMSCIVNHSFNIYRCCQTSLCMSSPDVSPSVRAEMEHGVEERYPVFAACTSELAYPGQWKWVTFSPLVILPSQRSCHNTRGPDRPQTSKCFHSAAPTLSVSKLAALQFISSNTEQWWQDLLSRFTGDITDITYRICTIKRPEPKARNHSQKLTISWSRTRPDFIYMWAPLWSHSHAMRQWDPQSRQAEYLTSHTGEILYLLLHELNIFWGWIIIFFFFCNLAGIFQAKL